VAALPPPLGRVVMLSQLLERFRVGQARTRADAASRWVEFRLEMGLPSWTLEVDGHRIHKQLWMTHGQNTVYVRYSLLPAPEQGTVAPSAADAPPSEPLTLELCPWVNFRPHDERLDRPAHALVLAGAQGRYEMRGSSRFPTLRFVLQGPDPNLRQASATHDVHYREEQRRGYDCGGPLASPGVLTARLLAGRPVTLIASTEPWAWLEPAEPAARREAERRRELLVQAKPAARSDAGAELVLAADQFIVRPAGPARASTVAQGESPTSPGTLADEASRTLIAGYPWFTDWGRDTMISLEGLCLCTGRVREARRILQRFAEHQREGLLPNLFPEGTEEGVYHTADASLWFFHAVHRYLATTGDAAFLDELLPTLRAIVAHHTDGTRFGIGIDRDGLLRQGEDGYQLTWMDAKVDGWVVTPRRGKAVELNALWYNALRLLAGWLAERGDVEAAGELGARADQCQRSFNERFWFAEGGYLYDVVDGPEGNDAACRPNQLFALTLDHPVLLPEQWAPVLRVAERELLTPFGLRTLSRGHPDYHGRYEGDLRRRDAAYHQGTVWPWLLGPYVDAWLRVHPERTDEARRLVHDLTRQLGAGCLGTLSELTDAEPPFAPRGCLAQAWSVAEALRLWCKTMQSR
jgi:glycogen debranching enzyme